VTESATAGMPRVITAAEAEGIAVEALDALEVLAPVIAEETALLKDGRIRQALDLSERKGEAAARYQRALQEIKANAVALGRFAPPSLALLRRNHESFAEVMELNMAVLGTTRTVSESLMRELAAQVGHGQQPQGYGAYGQQTGAYRPQATPLAVSKAL
jgi:hypothetical protein